MKSEIKAAEVQAAVREYVDKGGHGGEIEVAFTTCRAVADLAGFDSGLAGNVWAQRSAETKFNGQVLRAFNKLADDGVLRKVGAGTYGPDGTYIRRNSVRFYTPEAWDKAVHEHQVAEAAEAARAERWAALYDWLGRVGVNSLHARGRELWIGLEGWEALREMANELEDQGLQDRPDMLRSAADQLDSQ